MRGTATAPFGRTALGKSARLRSSLLATSALSSMAGAAALLWAAAVEPAVAGPVCAIAVTGASGAVANAGTVNCISINNANVTGNIVNSGKLTSNTVGVAVSGSTIAGGLQDSGLIAGGITFDATSKLTQFGTAILLSGSTFSGGISNAGTISGAQDAIWEKTSTFTGGITNSGTISATGETIQIEGGSFSGGISNSGTITSAHISAIDVVSVTTFAGGINNQGLIAGNEWAIELFNVSTFSGGIANSGTITAGGVNYPAIAIANVSTFSGGISNGGTISAPAAIGIALTNISVFSGDIVNNGVISGVGAAHAGMQIGQVSTFLGGITNSGTISGDVGIGIGPGTGPVSIFDSGVITGSGGSAIAFAGSPGNTFTLGAGYQINGRVLGSGSDTFQLGGSGSGAFDLSTIGTGHQYQGFTTFNVVGGIWTVTNTFGQPQAWAVNGGTLAGTGTLNAVNVNTGGTLAPGTPGAPGTVMTINGNLAFQSGATYLVQINGATASSANVSGTAALDGAVKVSGIAGMMTYDILHTGGLNNTQFQPFSEAGYSGTLSYSATDVFLNVTSGNVAPTGANQNQQNVANALNAYFNSGGTLTPNFATIFGLSGGNLNTALAQLSGEANTGGENASFEMMSDFLGVMIDPTAGGRGGAPGTAGNAFAAEQSDALPPDIASAYASVLRHPAPAAPFEQRWTAWGQGFGGYNKTDGNAAAGTNTVTATASGFAGGLDYHFTPDSYAGFAVAGSAGNWGLAQNLGNGRSDSMQIGLYGTQYFGAAYVAGAVGLANDWMKTSRTAPLGDQLSASFNAQSYGGRLEAGYRYGLAMLGVTPYAAVQTQLFHAPAYSETDLTGGGLGLTYASTNATDTRSELGARFDSVQVFNQMPLVWRARLAWAHDWVSNPSLTATFETLPGANFVVNGAGMPADSALTALGAELYVTPHLSLEAKFDGSFAKTAETYAGSGTVRYRW
ncbi:MAG TPA: autotransporter domain-containing protein [Xanthobacteraceae bacterium]|nr:autotransporter domain-containing protein [Xanthobacteraceae bacterium]